MDDILLLKAETQNPESIMLQEELHCNSLLKLSPNFNEDIYVHKWIVLMVLGKEGGDNEKEERPDIL